MKFKIGKTLYESNLYLKDSDNNLINKSNIDFLLNKFSYREVSDLSSFVKEDDLLILDKNLTSSFKRPKLIIYKKTIYLRDDLFFKLNLQMNKDPVLDYNTLIKIEKNIEDRCLIELHSNFKNLDFNSFVNSYKNEKSKGSFKIDLNEGFIGFKYSNKLKNNRKLLKND